MKKMINTERIEGRVYQHNLTIKTVQNQTSANFGKEFISGQLEVAVDEEGLNIIPVHYTYVTETTSAGNKNATYANLKKIIESKIVAIFMIIVSIFCLWIQLNAIYQYLGNLSIFSDIIIKAICILIMIALTLFLYKDGLIKSIFLDNPLWYVCYLILFILVIYGVLSDIELYNIKYLNNRFNRMIKEK